MGEYEDYMLNVNVNELIEKYYWWLVLIKKNEYASTGNNSLEMQVLSTLNHPLINI